VFEWIKAIPPWVLWTIVGVSVFTFVVSLVILRIALIRMSADYFTRERKANTALRKNRPIVWLLGVIGKNILGFLLLIAGLIMLAAPGQGLLTILMGIALMNFPGKRRLEVALIRRPSIHKSINWVRKRNDKPPIEIPEK
jgi:hypothetical protein